MSADSMTSGWYYSKQGVPPGQQAGPLSWEELYALARSETLAPTDLVWNAGLSAWLPAAQIAGLFPGFAVPQPPWPQGAQPRRRRSVLSWALPLVLVALAALTVGLVFGLRDGDGNDATSTAGNRTTTTEIPTATTRIPTATTEIPTATTRIPATTTTEAPPGWVALNPAGDRPDGRAFSSMVYAAVVGKLILFGGWNAATDLQFADTWTCDPVANTWTELDPTGDAPSGRDGHSMVYATGAGQVILFGGWDGNDDLADTWAYNPVANTWTELDPTGDAPGGRDGHSMVYDPTTGKVILFGGWRHIDEGFVYYDDTWAYDPAANTWTDLDPAGDVPAGRGLHSMVYDPNTGLMVLFGGRADRDESSYLYYDDTWAYDPATNTWAKLDPSGAVPTARSAGAMVHDPDTERVILFGGWDDDEDFNDTWAYDPVANMWNWLDPTGDTPAARSGHSMAFDSLTGLLVLFGGYDAAGDTLNDTWFFGR